MNSISRDIYRRYSAVVGFSPDTAHARAKAREAALQLGNAPGATLDITNPVITDDIHAGLIMLAAAGAIKENSTSFYWEAEKV